VTYQATRCGVKILTPQGVEGKMADAELSDKPLKLFHLDGTLLMEIAADRHWTVERVKAILDADRACELVSAAYGGDAYIGSGWIGSTEV
jgi:hypothetical protein